jgi:amidase
MCGMSSETWRMDAVELAAAIREKQISAAEATESALARLQAVNGALNAVTAPLADAARAAAKAADVAAAAGAPLGPLHGVPVTMKENIDMAGCSTPNGVVAYEKNVAATDSPPAANWKRAGAIVIGRTNTPAFSARWDTDNALRGRTYNPWSRKHTPGGSSGGAASSVASGAGHIAHGNDYGGSIRYPAYCCGVAGIRPSLGRVPAFNSTNPSERPMTAQLMSVQGPLARRVRDVRLGLAAMAARDARDPWWVPAPLDGPAVEVPVRVALADSWGGSPIHAEVKAALARAAKALTDAGYAVEPAAPPDVARIAELWLQVVNCEMRMLVDPAMQKDGDAGIKASQKLMYQIVAPLDMEGYLRALAERNKWLREWSLFHERYPLVLAPVSLEPPFEIGFDTGSVERKREVVRAQAPLYVVNCLGLPALAVPTGVANGLPSGVQLIGQRFREDLCLAAGEAIEARMAMPTPIDPASQP